MTDLGCSSAPSLEGRRSIELVLEAPRPPSSFVLSTRIVFPRTHCHTRVPSVITSGSQEREPFLGIWYRRFQDFSTRQICWLSLLGGKLLETSPPTKCSDGSSMEYKWNSRRVFPLRRNLRCPIRRPGRCGFCASGSSQGPTHRGLSRPCSGRGTVSLQVKISHTTGHGQPVYRARPL
jgi:hypothetical protein